MGAPGRRGESPVSLEALACVQGSCSASASQSTCRMWVRRCVPFPERVRFRPGFPRDRRRPAGCADSTCIHGSTGSGRCRNCQASSPTTCSGPSMKRRRGGRRNDGGSNSTRGVVGQAPATWRSTHSASSTPLPEQSPHRPERVEVWFQRQQRRGADYENGRGPGRARSASSASAASCRRTNRMPPTTPRRAATKLATAKGLLKRCTCSPKV